MTAKERLKQMAEEAQERINQRQKQTETEIAEIKSQESKLNAKEMLAQRAEQARKNIETNIQKNLQKQKELDDFIKNTDLSKVQGLKLPNALSHERVNKILQDENKKKEEIEYYKNNPATFGSNLNRNLLQPIGRTIRNAAIATGDSAVDIAEYLYELQAAPLSLKELTAESNKTWDELIKEKKSTPSKMAQYTESMRQRALQKTQELPTPLARKIAESGMVVGDMVPSIALGATPLGVYGSTIGIFARSASNAQQEALNNGATYEQARLNGVLNGLLETTVEMIGGKAIGKLTKMPTLTSKIGGKLLSKAPKGVKTFLELLKDVGEEGLEEMISDFVQPYIDRVTYNPEAPLANFKSQWEAFSSSIIPSLMFAGINAGASNVISYTDKQMTIKSVNNQINNLANKQIEQIENTDLSMVEKINLINEVKKQQNQVKNNFTTEINKFEVTYPEKYKNLDAQVVNANVNKNLDELRSKHNVTINSDGTTNLLDRLKIKYNIQNNTNFTKTTPINENISQNNVQNVSNLQKTVQNNSTIQGLEDYTEQDIKDLVSDYIQDLDTNVQIKGIAINGSRARGDSQVTSDLDVVVEYDGDMSEDALFNILNEEPLIIDGIQVDINPITASKSGTLEQYMQKFKEYDNSKNVDIMEDGEYNSYRTVERKEDYKEGEIHASFTIQPSEFEQIRSEVSLYKMNEQDGLHYIDLSKDGYFSYIYKKQGDSITPIVQLRGHEDVLNFVRRRIENGNYKEYGTARRWSSVIRNEYRNYNGDISDMQYERQTDKNDVDNGRQNRQESKDNRRRTDNRSEENSTTIENSEEQGSFSMDEDTLSSRKIDKADSYKTNAERISALIEQRITAIENGKVKRQEDLGIVSRKEIRQKIEKYLNRPIRTGGFRERAYAIYKPAIQSIRTKQLTDIDSIIHELGHHIDLAQLHITPTKDTRTWKKGNAELAEELNQLCEKSFGSVYDNAPKVKLEEGFAEFTRRYVIDTENAIKYYPHIADLITEAREKNEELDKLFITLIKDVNAHVNMTPEERIISNISINEDENKNFSVGKFIDGLMYEIYDDNWYLKKTVNELAKRAGKGNIHKLKPSENSYILYRLANSGSDQTTNMLGKGIRDWDTNEKITQGFSSVLEPITNAEEMTKLRALLIAQRNKDYVKKGQQTGIRKSDAISTVNLLEKNTKIKDVAEAFRKENDGILEYARREGLIDAEQIKQIKKMNENYVAMNRVMDDEGKIISASTKGAKVGKTFYKTTGSDREIVDPIESTIVNASRIVRQIENNKVLKTLVNLAKQSNEYADMFEIVPPPMEYKGSVELSAFEKALERQGVDTTELNLEEVYNLFNMKLADDKNKIMSYIENGNRKYVQFYDENLYNTLKGMNGQNMGMVEKFLNIANTPLRYGATMANAEFSLPNAISDSQQAFLYSDSFFIPGVDNVLGIINTLAGRNKSFSKFIEKIFPEYVEKQKEFYDLYIQSGASQSGKFSPYRRKIRENATEVYDKKRKILFGKFDNKTGTYKVSPTKVKGILNLAQTLVNKAMDVMTYASELTEESTRFQNFRKEMKLYKKKGLSNRDIRLKSAINAKDITQDFGRTGRTMRSINRVIPFSAARVGSAYRIGEEIHAHPYRTSLRLAIIVALGLAIKAFTDDKENKHVEELTDQKKKDNFIIAYDKTSEPLTIKKIQGPARSLINLSEYLYDLINGNLKGKEGEKLIEWMNDTIFDILPAEDLGNMTPQIIKPLLENWLNKDFYYKTDLISQNLQKDVKPKDQYDEYTSEFAILLGNVLNYSPIYIDNLFEGYFAGVGQQILDGLDKVLDVTDKGEQPDKNKSEQFILKRFFASGFRSGASIDEVYDLSKELAVKKEYNEATEKELEQLKDLEKAKDMMSKLNKEIKAARNNLSLSSSKKKEKIDELQALRTDVARYYLGKTLINRQNQNQIELFEYYPSNTTYKYKPKNGLQVNVQFTEADQKRYAEICKKEYEKSLYELESTKEYYQLSYEEKEAKLDGLLDSARTKAKNQVSKEVYEREH